MGVLSGIGGAVDTAETVRNWSADVSEELVAAYASNTKAGPHRLDGNLDWSGIYTGYGSIPTMMPGDSIASLKLSLDATDGIEGPAIIDRVDITWDWEGRIPISYSVAFSGNGDCTFGSAVATDGTIPADLILPSTGCKIELSDVREAAADWIEVEGLRSATLSMWASNTSYVNSSSAGVIKRIRGNFDASMSFSIHTADFADLATASLTRPTDWDLSHSMGVKMYTTSSLHWLLHWMKLNSVSDMVCDRETGAMVGMTLNWDFNGFHLVGATPTATEGYIKTPAVSPADVWPYA